MDWKHDKFVCLWLRCVWLEYKCKSTGFKHNVSCSMMSWTQFFIWQCISMWRELLCLLFCPRACEMRVNRLLTSLWGPWGLLTRQSLCLTAVDGLWRWQCIHKPLCVTTNVTFFSAEDVEPIALLHFCAYGFIKRMSRPPEWPHLNLDACT